MYTFSAETDTIIKINKYFERDLRKEYDMIKILRVSSLLLFQLQIRLEHCKGKVVISLHDKW